VPDLHNIHAYFFEFLCAHQPDHVTIEISAPLRCARIVGKETRRETCGKHGLDLRLASFSSADRAGQLRSIKGELRGERVEVIKVFDTAVALAEDDQRVKLLGDHRFVRKALIFKPLLPLLL